MTHCLYHTACPECRRNGNDRSGDNLAVYSDGSSYCFNCGYRETGSGSHRFKSPEPKLRKTIALPSDSVSELPKRGLEYLKRYGITDLDIQNNFIMWSEYKQRLIFPYFDETGLIGWQGRYLGEKSLDKFNPKWYTQGDFNVIFHRIGNVNSDTLVLTEDVISAIKVAHNTEVCACPIFGSHISTRKFLLYKKFYGKLIIWLDKDKEKEAMSFSHQANNLGLSSRTVITDKDPKEISDEEIKLLTNESTSVKISIK